MKVQIWQGGAGVSPGNSTNARDNPLVPLSTARRVSGAPSATFSALGSELPAQLMENHGDGGVGSQTPQSII